MTQYIACHTENPEQYLLRHDCNTDINLNSTKNQLLKFKTKKIVLTCENSTKKASNKAQSEKIKVLSN